MINPSNINKDFNRLLKGIDISKLFLFLFLDQTYVLTKAYVIDSREVVAAGIDSFFMPNDFLLYYKHDVGN